MRRTPNFFLAVFGTLLVICLMGVAYGHVRYSDAEHVYQAHLQHVVIGPHTDIKRQLENDSQTVDKWFHVRTAASALAVMAIIGILVQVFRHRELRLAGTTES